MIKNYFFKILILLLIATSAIKFDVFSQTPYVIPAMDTYSCGFEDPAENSEWTLENCVINDWHIGGAIKSDGQNSLYITPDGGTSAGHDDSGTFVTAYRDFSFGSTKKLYRITFDWYNPTGAGKLYVGWNEPATGISYCSNTGSAEPVLITNNALKWNGADTIMQNSTSLWQHADIIVLSPAYTTDVRRLFFSWISDKDSKGRPGGAIDNINITPIMCPGVRDTLVKNLEYKIIDKKAVFTWDYIYGSKNIRFDLKYRDVRNSPDTWIEHSNLGQSADTLEKILPKGIYDVRIRIICNDGVSGWYVFNPFPIFQSETDCLNFWDLKSPDVIATHAKLAVDGTGIIPGTNKVELVNLGPTSAYSHHTVHFDDDEYDIQTGGKLKTVPKGMMATVRLGNWSTGAGTESLTYKYHVPDGKALMLLKYAAVMQDPKHDPDKQPRFKMEILDEKMKPIENGSFCGKEDFISGKGTDGWKVIDDVLWKDWTSFGIKLGDYANRDIYIRLTTLDCAQGGHYGYAYFTLECIRAELAGISCSDTQDSITAPEGFKYKWYRKYDNPSFIRCNERVFKPDPTDTCTYVCKLIYKEEGSNECYLELEVPLAPRYPQSKFEYKKNYVDCATEVIFKNTSYAIDQNNKIIPNETPDSYLWDFGDGGKSEFENPTHTYTKSGTYKVRLFSYTNNTCADTLYSQEITIDEMIPYKGETLIWNKCKGETVDIEGILYTETPKDTIVIKKKTATYGCDSITTIVLTFHDTIKNEFSYTLRQYEEPCFMLGDDCITESGSHTAKLKSKAGCDSIVTVHLTSYPPIKVDAAPSLVEVCLGQGPSFDLTYQILSGDFSTYSVEFDEAAHQAGFSDIILVPKPVSKETIELQLPLQVRPNIYNATLSLDDANYGHVEIPVEITISYPAEIIAQKWNDVLALLKDNGGYEFSYYQWYKNGIPMTGENKSYIYVPDILDFNAEYKVEVTRTDDHITAFTCPFIPTKRLEVNIFPTLVPMGQGLTVETPVQGKAILWDVMGLKIKEYDLNADYNILQMPNKAGVYYLDVTTENNDRNMFNIVIK